MNQWRVIDWDGPELVLSTVHAYHYGRVHRYEVSSILPPIHAGGSRRRAIRRQAVSVGRRAGLDELPGRADSLAERDPAARPAPLLLRLPWRAADGHPRRALAGGALPD